MANKLTRDEADLILLFLGKERDSINGQIGWYNNHDPNNSEHINTRYEYLKRLKLLRKKIDALVSGDEQ